MKARRHGLRRHLSLLVSGSLVLLIGALGLMAGKSAGDQAREVHRADRLQLQETLGTLVEQYALLGARDVLDLLGGLPEEGAPTWSTAQNDPASVVRLENLVRDSRTVDVGAVLVDGLGTPLATYVVPGQTLPDRTASGWAPLRAAVLRRDGSLPLSGVLPGGTSGLLAMGLPVPLENGSKGLLLCLWDARASKLQTYVAQIDRGETGAGYVVDGAGTVIASSDASQVGQLLPLPGVLDGLDDAPTGVLDTTESGTAMVTTHAVAGRTGWTSLGVQTAAEFEGALKRSSALAQAAVVLLLLAAATALVVLHRKREAALQSVALRDELTGLYNRRGWFTLAEHELERARRQESARILLFIDVDGLKQVNDGLGHREGDRAIVDAARVLTAASRASDLVGRLGGDEFVLMLGEDGDIDVARRRVLVALATHNADSGARFELRLSLGAELWFPDSGCSLDELVRRADADMYVDKTSRPARHEGVLRLPAPRDTEVKVG